MKKFDALIGGFRAERWKWRLWRISLFCITRFPSDETPNNFDFDYRQDGVYCYLDKEWILLEDANPNEELFDNRKLAEFPANLFAHHPEPITTTYGRALFNKMVIEYAFGDKFGEFIHYMMPNKIAAKFIPRFVKKGDEDKAVGGSPIYADEVARFVEGILNTTSLCQYITPTGTETSLTIDKSVREYRDKVLDELGDNITLEQVAELKKEMARMDKATQSQDSLDFYLGSKPFDVTRMRNFGMYGDSRAFQKSGEFTLVRKSLDEGVDLDTMVAKNNETREGSYDRGNNTAFGGAKANGLYRIFQDATVDMHDCGADTQLIAIEEDNYHDYLNMNYVENGTVAIFTEEIAKTKIGKTIRLRRPILCQAGGTDPKRFCLYCTSMKLANDPSALKSLLYNVGSEIMYVFMKAMHGSSLKTSHFQYRKHIK